MCSGAWLSFVLISVCYMLCLTSGATYFIGCISGSITWHSAQFEESFKCGRWMHPSFPGFEGCTRWTFHGPAYPKVHSCPAFSPGQGMVEEQWVGQAATSGQWDVSWGGHSSWQGWTSSVKFRLSQSTKDAAFAHHVGRILRRLQPLNRASVWSASLLLISSIPLVLPLLHPPGSHSSSSWSGKHCNPVRCCMTWVESKHFSRGT